MGNVAVKRKKAEFKAYLLAWLDQISGMDAEKINGSAITVMSDQMLVIFLSHWGSVFFPVFFLGFPVFIEDEFGMSSA